MSGAASTAQVRLEMVAEQRENLQPRGPLVIAGDQGAMLPVRLPEQVLNTVLQPGWRRLPGRSTRPPGRRVPGRALRGYRRRLKRRYITATVTTPEPADQ
jgi:hypothetical protein